jgi:hypothetical protein
MKRVADIGQVLTLPHALMNQAAINRHIATVVREQGESIDKSALLVVGEVRRGVFSRK